MHAHVLNPSPTETAILGELSTKCLGKTPQKLAQCRIWDTKKAKSNQDCPPNVSQKKNNLQKLAQCRICEAKKENSDQDCPSNFRGKTQKLAHDRIWDTKKTKSDQDCLSNFTEKLHESLLMAESGTRRKRRVTRSVTKFQFIDQLSVCCPVCGGVARKRAP